MATLSTHVLDTSRGRPAAGVPVALATASGEPLADAVTDADGRPRHSDGTSDVPGLHFLGFPWLSRRGSGIVHGVGVDAERMVHRITSLA